MLPKLLHRRPGTDFPVSPFSRNIDDMFGEFLDWWRGSSPELSEGTAAYPVDIREDHDQILVDAEMPGFEKDEVDITVEQGMLNIRAEHREEKDEQSLGKSYLKERSYRRIQRSFSLPVAVDESKVDAKLKDGVLHLTMPKAKEAMPNKITVK